MNEVEALMFKEKLRGVIIKTIIGVVIGCILGFSMGRMDGNPLGTMLGCAFLLGGIPYAYSIIPISFFSIVGIAIKLAIAAMIGWIVTPIALTYNLIQYNRYKKKAMKENKEE